MKDETQGRVEAIRAANELRERLAPLFGKHYWFVTDIDFFSVMPDEVEPYVVESDDYIAGVTVYRDRLRIVTNEDYPLTVGENCYLTREDAEEALRTGSWRGKKEEKP